MAYTTIADPSEYFQTLLYTGNGASSRALTNDGNSNLQPDWVWIKDRSAAYHHILGDSSRGSAKKLASDGNYAENDSTELNTSYGYVDTFNTDGFTTGGGSLQVNKSSNSYVAWQWKANGGTTASNTDGSITSTVQANTDAGFNILTYTGTGANATVGHGLGVVPKLVIYKRRSAIENWGVYHPSTGNTGCCFLNLTIAKSTASSYFNNTSPTSTTLSVGTNPAFNGDGSTYVAYCFAEKKGYSRIGKYTGNGSTDGTFVYTGFKPAWVMAKRTDSANSWVVLDNKRNTSNAVTNYIQPNAADAEGTSGLDIDFLSNGFKWRTTSAAINANGGTNIYMAFAERPFVTPTGTLTTAR